MNFRIERAQSYPIDGAYVVINTSLTPANADIFYGSLESCVAYVRALLA